MARRIVCVICDETKDDAESLSASVCETCGKVTSSREVAGDGERIHPQSAMTFREQRSLFEEC